MKTIGISITMALLLLLLPSSVLAHVPIFFWPDRAPVQRAYTIEDIGGRSTANYGFLAGGAVHQFNFTAQPGDPLQLHFLVLPGEQRSLQAMLTTPAGEEIASEPLSIPIFEVFTQMNLTRVGRIELPAPAGGLYRLEVWHEGGAAADNSPPLKYILATGTKEVFGPFDLFKTPLWWMQARLWQWW